MVSSQTLVDMLVLISHAAAKPSPRAQLQHAIEGFARVIGADVATISDVRVGPQVPGGIALVEFLECGTWTHEQRQLYLDYLAGDHATDPLLRVFGQRLTEAGPDVEAIVLDRRDGVIDAEWYGCEHWRVVREPIGLDHCFYMAVRAPQAQATPDAPGRWLGSGLHRRRGREPFTPEHALLAGAFVRGVAPLFERLAAEPMGSALFLAQLSPRERDLVFLLIDGHAPKEIASRWGLQTATVHTYVKRLCQKAGVAGRAQLTAKCNAMGIRSATHAAPNVEVESKDEISPPDPLIR